MKKLPLVAKGPNIYDICRKTLLFWLSSRHNKVYLVSPFLDEYFLKQFLYIIKKNEATANIGKIFIREECADEWVRGFKKKRKVKFNEILDRLTKPWKDFFSEKLSRDFIQIKGETNYFHCKFMACVNTKTSTAEVLLTSANFNETHFTIWDNGDCNHDSLGYHKMSKEKFEKISAQSYRSVTEIETNKTSYRTTQRQILLDFHLLYFSVIW